MSLNAMVRVFMYVNPGTKTVEKVMCYTAFGITERMGADWEPTTRAKSGIDDLSADKIYELDWDTDFVPMDSEEEDSEHAAIALYDNGRLTEEDCMKYGKLYLDPNDDSNPTLDRLIGK
jgi:hypothetical protein